MDLTIALLRKGSWAIRQASQELPDAFRIKRVVVVLIVEFFKVKAIVPTHLGVPTVTVVAAEDRVVGVNDVVARLTRWDTLPRQEN